MKVSFTSALFTPKCHISCSPFQFNASHHFNPSTNSQGDFVLHRTEAGYHHLCCQCGMCDQMKKHPARRHDLEQKVAAKNFTNISPVNLGQAWRDTFSFVDCYVARLPAKHFLCLAGQLWEYQAMSERNANEKTTVNPEIPRAYLLNRTLTRLFISDDANTFVVKSLQLK